MLKVEKPQDLLQHVGQELQATLVLFLAFFPMMLLPVVGCRHGDRLERATS